ncbi:10244_t:CDS:2, partial [Ambispora gerdemannii]
MFDLYYYIECENSVPDKSFLICVYPKWLKNDDDFSDPWLQSLLLEDGATSFKFSEKYGIVYSDYVTTVADDAALKRLAKRKVNDTKIGKAWQLKDDNGAPTLIEDDINISRNQITVKNATKQQIITGLTIGNVIANVKTLKATGTDQDSTLTANIPEDISYKIAVFADYQPGKPTKEPAAEGEIRYEGDFNVAK